MSFPSRVFQSLKAPVCTIQGHLITRTYAKSVEPKKILDILNLSQKSKLFVDLSQDWLQNLKEYLKLVYQMKLVVTEGGARWGGKCQSFIDEDEPGFTATVKADKVSSTLAFMKHNIYFVGFKLENDVNGNWFGLSGSNVEIREGVVEVTGGKMGVTYTYDLLGTSVGIEDFKRAIENLAYKQSMAKSIAMVCYHTAEALRFKNVLKTVVAGSLFCKDTAFSDEEFKALWNYLNLDKEENAEADNDCMDLIKNWERYTEDWMEPFTASRELRGVESPPPKMSREKLSESLTVLLCEKEQDRKARRDARREKNNLQKLKTDDNFDKIPWLEAKPSFAQEELKLKRRDFWDNVMAQHPGSKE